MSWLQKLTPPGVQKMFEKRDTPENLWVKCPISGEMVFNKDLEASQHVTPAGHHMRIGPALRFKYTFDGDYTEVDLPEVAKDPLKFKDDKPYTSRLAAARKKTGREDAMAIGVGSIKSIETTVLVQDFSFMGGSLGMGAGEGFLKACETAVERRTPLVVFTAAGGARMQEGALSLMQMPRTTLGVQMLKDAKLPYLVVLTDPTTGGVTASYAMLGDVQIAEPGALIGFAGPRVIEQTIREKLPEGFQRAEYLLDKGMVDKVVHRHELRTVLGNLMRTLLKRPAAADNTPARTE
ncbi:MULTISPECIES: acetyl-CoA carboxylase carboxyltransferase subunit beta [Oceanicaulis]|jgi:acetyl-CoA carboxylase carboxyl transferase subunit beta|uniref:acetyl-CoA carboxylase carboxyltransferase subunit beta n=1 Tax=Oceanicaulis TaxID=153232 RepID=UPI0003B64609|nr:MULTISPECIES: acetyl-CoA carboxylase carboxyltransferase subunit beta [Oceanicaulis]MBL4538518.1 acetyl-CoA carboxylase carboxyltransferase subunit beta [Oceanicaulis sp.]HCR66834.1 acetyl-CoA carboxylase carboxyltransferase subunit beta [Oceanicaulis sp.]